MVTNGVCPKLETNPTNNWYTQSYPMFVPNYNQIEKKNTAKNGHKNCRLHGLMSDDDKHGILNISNELISVLL